MKITRTRGYTINMGNYESFKTEATVELEVVEHSDPKIEAQRHEEGFAKAEQLLTLALRKDLSEAAEVTLTQNSFILTMEL